MNTPATLYETDRLIVRSFCEGDAAALFDYLHRPTASCFFSLALSDMAAAAQEAKQRGIDNEYFAVCLKHDGALVGDVFAHPEKDQPDTFSIGWNFNPRFAGQGYAHEAAVALVDYLFNERGLRRLYAYVEDTNLPSQRLCEKLGMRREGLFMEFVSFMKDDHGVPVYENTYQYAVLSKEWRTTQSRP
ncbi:GNAT family N-acetyltransferase [Pseudomonas parafulva]|uniref:GNAT family N-acetyltransferase n=1 Tax=Pseudomonas parafulva TaxID=157782 RepID=UPI000A453AD3|nr:GNAT family protein [Pseudomonas parafulva]